MHQGGSTTVECGSTDMLSGGTLSGRLGENCGLRGQGGSTDVPTEGGIIDVPRVGAPPEGAPPPRGKHRCAEGGRIAAQGGSTAEGAPRRRGEAPMC